MSILEALREAVIEGDVVGATRLTESGVKAGALPDKLFSGALAPAMEEVGRRMQRSEYYIPEVLLSAKAMKAAAGILKPLIVQSGSAQPRGKVVIGTVQGDLHDIGKNLVIMMLEGAGCQVVDLGSDVPPQRFVEAVREHRPDVVAMSALLTTTMMQMPKVMGALKAEQLLDGLRVMIGGAPVTDKFAEEIGADACGADAACAVQLVKGWMPAERGDN